MDEVNELAQDLADSYTSYFDIDVSEEEKKLDEFIEECLTHLEEACSVWEVYRSNSGDIGLHLENLASRNVKLRKLFDQIDALEEYMFQTSQLLSQLEAIVEDLSSRRASKQSNKIRKIIDMIGILGGLGGPSFVDEDPEQSPPVPLEETLFKVRNIETQFETTNLALHTRLEGEWSLSPSI